MFAAVRAVQVVFAIGIAFLLAGNAAAERRVALVIGNGAYASLPALPNPANDAHDIATLLGTFGFEVLEGIDLDRSGFVALTGEFLDSARGADAALVYYAGHGIQYEEDNYFIPVDASITSAYGLKSEAVSLKGLLGELEGLAKVNLVFLDACRDNPLAERIAATSTRSARSLGRGLTRVDPSSANTLIAFAAAPGQVALDGTERNSPFASAFLRQVGSSRDEISILFKAIARDVAEATGDEQHPQIVSAMTVNFYFQGGDATVAVTEFGNSGQAAYDAAARIGTERAHQAIIDGFPNSVQASLALAAIEQMHQQGAEVEAPAPESGASLIVNGSFERIDMETWPGGFWTPNGGSSAIPGWIVTGVSVDYVVAPYWQASDGIASLDLNGTTLVGGSYLGGVSQTFATIAGQQYVVRFDLAGNPDAREQSLVVTAPGTTQHFAVNTAGKTLAAMGYTAQQFTFTATGSTSTLSFSSADGLGDFQGPVIDNVVVTASRVSAGQ